VTIGDSVGNWLQYINVSLTASPGTLDGKHYITKTTDYSGSVTATLRSSVPGPTGILCDIDDPVYDQGDWMVVTFKGHGKAMKIELTPEAIEVAIDSAVVYSVTAYDGEDNAWDVTADSSFAAPDLAGTWEGNTFWVGTLSGVWIITTTYGTLFDTAVLTVASCCAATIEITPTEVTLTVGETQQFIGVAADAYSNPIPVAWSVSGPLAGTITADGLFTAGTVAGEYTDAVVATADVMTATADVTVVAGPLLPHMLFLPIVQAGP